MLGAAFPRGARVAPGPWPATSCSRGIRTRLSRKPELGGNTQSSRRSWSQVRECAVARPAPSQQDYAPRTSRQGATSPVDRREGPWRAARGRLSCVRRSTVSGEERIMTENQLIGRHQPATAIHADERPWELLRWPGQWSKMLVHPTRRAARRTRMRGSCATSRGRTIRSTSTISPRSGTSWRASSGSASGPTARGRCSSTRTRTSRSRSTPTRAASCSSSSTRGPTTGGRPIYEGRFNMTARKRIEEENVEA